MSNTSDSQIWELHECVRTYLTRFGSNAGQVTEAWRAEMIARNIGIIPKRRRNKSLSSEQTKILGTLFPRCIFDELEK